MTVEPRLGRSSPAPHVIAERASDRFAFARSLIMLSDPTGSAAEAIRALRTHLMAQHIHEGRRALALCAVSQGVGCSFVAANLAVGLAQIGVKTLLMDANLRDPSVDTLFLPASPPSGLAQCLAAEDQNFGRHVEIEVLDNLSVMFSGGQSPNPQELLASDRFNALMDFCLREFEVTLVDTPAANTCADARRVSTVTGYSLIVARRNVTYVDDIRTLVSQLQADRARVVGTVLNNG